MIKQILFDCGGVFVDVRFRELFEEITGDSAFAADVMKRFFAADSPWHLYDRGDYKRDEIGKLMREYMLDIPEMVFDTFLEKWPYALPLFPEMEDIVDRLHEAGYPCYLLSNFSEQFDDFAPSCPPLAKMDGLAISSRMGLIKPHADIFMETARRFHFKPEETLFVDDTLVNIEGAQKCGYQTHHFSTPEKFFVFLAENGILPNNK
ncbi:MAG: HAD family phosphatase [Clostridia bacterium]|nr:HAD family phosphatase [Clostridia bacterium]